MRFEEGRAATPAGFCATFASVLCPSDKLNLMPPWLSIAPVPGSMPAFAFRPPAGS
jgi:hypothetical protein